MGQDPYEGMTDDQVLDTAAGHLKGATALPVGSVEREITWLKFESAMSELDRRLVRHVLAKLREQG